MAFNGEAGQSGIRCARPGLHPLAESEENACHSQREPGDQTDEQCDDRHEDQAT